MILHSTDRKSANSELFSLVSCEECGLIYQNPRPGPIEIGRYYPETYGPYQPEKTWRPSEQNKLRREIIDLVTYLYFKTTPRCRLATLVSKQPAWIRHLARLGTTPLRSRVGPLPNFQEPGKLLEIGCGTGAYLDLVRDLGWETYGVEMGVTAATLAASKGHQVVCGTLEDAQWPQGYFQAVCLWHTLEHLHDPLASLRKIHRLLAPGAELLIEVPNWNSLSAAHFREDWFALELPRHLIFFTPDTLTQLLERSGFTIVDLQTLPSQFVIQQSQEYRRRSMAIKSPNKSQQAELSQTLDTGDTNPGETIVRDRGAINLARFNWRVMAWVEKQLNQGDLLRVYAQRA